MSFHQQDFKKRFATMGDEAESVFLELFPNAHRLGKVVHRHGLEGRVSGIHALSTPVDERILDEAFADPRGVIDDFTAIARSAAAAGADVVVPAEGVLNEVLFANGVREVDGATILDCVGTTLLYTELLVNLKRRIGAGVGRRWTYARPPEDVLALLSAIR